MFYCNTRHSYFLAWALLLLHEFAVGRIDQVLNPIPRGLFFGVPGPGLGGGGGGGFLPPP